MMIITLYVIHLVYSQSHLVSEQEELFGFSKEFFLLKQWLRLLLERDAKQLQLETKKMFQVKLYKTS